MSAETCRRSTKEIISETDPSAAEEAHRHVRPATLMGDHEPGPLARLTPAGNDSAIILRRTFVRQTRLHGAAPEVAAKHWGREA